MKIAKMHKGDYGNIKAYFDLLTDEGITIKGFKLVQGTDGLFVGFPSVKNDDNEYKATVWAEKDVKEQVNKIAMAKYSATAEPVNDTEVPF